MSNPLKGEVHFEARGQTFTFKLGVNAQVMIEKRVGMSMQRFIKDRFDNLGTEDVRMIFWAGLFRDHKLTEDEAGDLIDEIGPDRITEIFTEAFQVANPIADANGSADEARPPKAAKARIGMNS